MTRIIVLLNLKPNVDVEAYEAWARSTDLPIVRDLPSVDGFSINKVAGLLGSDNAAPYSYVEVIDVNDMQTFGEDVSTETMQKVAAEFQEIADAPVFMVTDSLDEG